MQDENQTKSQLLNELAELRRRVAELETPEAKYRSAVAGQAGKQSAAAAKLRRGMLQASETRYRRLFEAAQDGILILDADTGRLAVYYGCADTVLSVAHAQLDDVLAFVKENSF